MNKQNLLIAFFTLTALALLAANWFTTTPAVAAVSVKDRDYQVVTARVQTGGDAVYILDNRTGMFGVFTYDPSARRLTGRTAQPIMNAFRTR